MKSGLRTAKVFVCGESLLVEFTIWPGLVGTRLEPPEPPEIDLIEVYFEKNGDSVPDDFFFENDEEIKEAIWKTEPSEDF